MYEKRICVEQFRVFKKKPKQKGGSRYIATYFYNRTYLFLQMFALLICMSLHYVYNLLIIY